MSRNRSAATHHFASTGVTILGIVLAATPLALWVAWTPFGFLMVLTVGAISIVLLGILFSRSSPDANKTQTTDSHETRAVITEEFVEEMHKIFPLTYHHSRIEKMRFRRTMDRLRQLLRQ